MIRNLLLLFLAAAWPLVATTPRKPNVIIIVTDDQGYGDIGAHGNTMIRTPSLDRLHGESLRLTDFHVDPTCAPTRAALMTGRYSTRTGVWHTIMGRSLLHHDETTLAQVLQDNGYRTGIFGKWHLGDNYPMRPQDKGFGEVFIHGGGGIGQTPDHWGNTYFDNTYEENGRHVKVPGYCTDVFFQRATAFVRSHREQPFFLYLPLNVPHLPHNVADHYADYYRQRGVPAEMAKFYGMLTNFDENLGRFLEELKQLQLEENSLLVFMSDNGGWAGTTAGERGARKGKSKAEEGTWPGFNAGMRGTKGMVYEGGHRVPFFMRWPAGQIGGGRDLPVLTAHFDVLPTLVELCGLTFTPQLPLDGRSLAPLLRGPSAGRWPERTLFVHTQREEIPPKWRNSVAMTQRWRLVDGLELYDLRTDPEERMNVAAQHADVVTRLRQDYEAWWKTLEPEFNRFSAIVIGGPANPVSLTCHDWHSIDVPWNQEMVRQAPKANGWWIIEAASGGKYEFVLRQQPAVARCPIEGTRARIKCGEREATAVIPPGASEVSLVMDVPAGAQRLQTWFAGADGQELRGAFFVEIRAGR